MTSPAGVAADLFGEGSLGFRLSAIAINKAIKHVCKYGDTDIFPHLAELTFFRAECDASVSELQNLDLDTYDPQGAVEALAPKGRYSFRITHQLSAVDTILFLASVVEIGTNIEACRLPKTGIESFSYRLDDGSTESIFLDKHTYKDWLLAQQKYVQDNTKVKQVISTDISDFYARVNFHRLENLLDECAPNHGAGRFIKKIIGVIRAKQSFGLPVGGAAARVLAELSLVDTDTALQEQGISASRFVDDFRLFLTSDNDPYEVLSFLAQQLGINEGLSLNSSKTNVARRLLFLRNIKRMTNDVVGEAEQDALEALTAEIYFEESPDPDDIEILKGLNLLEMLNGELRKQEYDIGRIRVIFRALRIVKPAGATPFIIDNLSELVIFSKEVVLLMEALEVDNPGCFDRIAENIISEIIKPPASSVQLIRTWMLELFSRDIVAISVQQFRRIENLPSILDKRQLHRIRGRMGNKNYFRMGKTAVRQMPTLEQTAFVTGAACLPKDEYGTWVRAVKPVFAGPTQRLFLSWVEKNQDDVLNSATGTAQAHGGGT